MIVPVPLGARSYKITIGDNVLHNVGTMLKAFQPVSSAIIVTDSNVREYGHADRVADSIEKTGIPVRKLSFDPGEEIKSTGGMHEIWEALFDYETDRKAVLVAVGGGVIGDFVGFAAATYARGIRFFQVPTTLLSQVDSSVGGKVGINLAHGKNMVGAFHQPLGVLIDTETLKTLPEEQYLSGLGEVLKYAMSFDAVLFRFIQFNLAQIKQRDVGVMEHIIGKCCQIKARIVAKDEHDTKDQRIKLNYGHTCGHALEVLSGYTIPHGLAVAMGSIWASQLACFHGLLKEETLNRQINLYKALGLPVACPPQYSPTDIVRIMKHDKKAEFGKIRFVLPTRIGQCRVVDDIDPELLVAR